MRYTWPFESSSAARGNSRRVEPRRVDLHRTTKFLRARGDRQGVQLLHEGPFSLVRATEHGFGREVDTGVVVIPISGLISRTARAGRNRTAPDLRKCVLKGALAEPPASKPYTL